MSADMRRWRQAGAHSPSYTQLREAHILRGLRTSSNFIGYSCGVVYVKREVSRSIPATLAKSKERMPHGRPDHLGCVPPLVSKKCYMGVRDRAQVVAHFDSRRCCCTSGRICGNFLGSAPILRSDVRSIYISQRNITHGLATDWHPWAWRTPTS